MKSTNGITIVIILLVIGLAFFLADGLNSQKFGPSGNLSATVNVTCCDSGDGDACIPQTSETLSYNGSTYGLIKSKVQFVEGNIHLKDTGQKVGPNKEPLILNYSDIDNNVVNTATTNGYNSICRNGDTHADTYFKAIPTDQDKLILQQGYLNSSTFQRILQTYCTSAPNDELVFVCKANCKAAMCPANYSTSSCYGDSTTQYAVYAKIGATVPDFVKKCDKSSLANQQPSIGPQQITTPADKYSQHPNLQLRTFGVKLSGSVNPWFSPFCKPAIYLYPTQKIRVNVKVTPKYPLTLTIPDYPQNGWNITAYPKGEIISNGKKFDYLYYETKIPDLMVSKEKTGYVVEYSRLPELLSSLLPKLGLNTSESRDFAGYWKKALPKSNYYLVQVEPKSTLDAVAPLSISPKPDNIIRVTLYFQPLDKKITMKEPILTSVSRNGFTVVEWGGLFKKDKNHPFTCLM